MNVLGIETSCDETGVALYESNSKKITHRLHSQIDVHRHYGGVVPELAARDHIRFVLPLIDVVLRESGLNKNDIDGIAYTRGPGLMGALLVGSCIAKALAFGWNIPSIGVNHMEGHLLAAMLEKNAPSFPFISLLISGGHTQLIEVQEKGSYDLLGESCDDAVGEAFDKVASMLGLPYPGGPALENLACYGKSGNFHFPRPMIDRPGYAFSFSGLKTAVLYAIAKIKEQPGEWNQQVAADIALAFEEAIIDILLTKSLRALQHKKIKNIVIAGGVSANQHLRNVFDEKCYLAGYVPYYPRKEFCTDNGAMIAYAGYCRLSEKQYDKKDVSPLARWSLENLETIENINA